MELVHSISIAILLARFALLFLSYFWRERAKYLHLFFSCYVIEVIVTRQEQNFSRVTLALFSTFMVLLVPIPLTVGFHQAVSCAFFEIILSGIILKVVVNQDLLDYGLGIDAPLTSLAFILMRLVGSYLYDKWMRERILLKAQLERAKVEFQDTL